jgi:hypothetical protein
MGRAIGYIFIILILLISCKKIYTCAKSKIVQNRAQKERMVIDCKIIKPNEDFVLKYLINLMQ